MELRKIIEQFVSIAMLMVPLLREGTLTALERMVTIPAKDVRALCRGMAEPEIAEAVRLAQRMADAVSDFVVFVGSRGSVKPD